MAQDKIVYICMDLKTIVILIKKQIDMYCLKGPVSGKKGLIVCNINFLSTSCSTAGQKGLTLLVVFECCEMKDIPALLFLLCTCRSVPQTRAMGSRKPQQCIHVHTHGL